MVIFYLQVRRRRFFSAKNILSVGRKVWAQTIFVGGNILSSRPLLYIVVPPPPASSRRCFRSAFAASQQTNSFTHLSRPKAPLLHPPSAGLLIRWFQLSTRLKISTKFGNLWNLPPKGAKKTKSLKQNHLAKVFFHIFKSHMADVFAKSSACVVLTLVSKWCIIENISWPIKGLAWQKIALFSSDTPTRKLVTFHCTGLFTRIPILGCKSPY